MTEKQRSEFLDFTEKLARASGEFIVPIYKSQSMELEFKEDDRRHIEAIWGIKARNFS